MTATATHDTKLGEDVRARVAVLSQLPGEWRKAVSRWTRINRAHRTLVQGEPAPDRNDEYRFYQVVVGAWPAQGGPPDATFVARVSQYMEKAVKEVIARIGEFSAPVLEMTKKVISSSMGLPLKEAMKKSQDVYLNQLMALEDVQEGLRAVLEMRKPVWKNK